MGRNGELSLVAQVWQLTLDSGGSHSLFSALFHFEGDEVPSLYVGDSHRPNQTKLVYCRLRRDKWLQPKSETVQFKHVSVES